MISDRENAASSNVAAVQPDPFHSTKSSVSSRQIVLKKSAAPPQPQNAGQEGQGMVPIDWGDAFVAIASFLSTCLATIASFLAAGVNAFLQRCARLKGGYADPLPSEVIAKIALYHHDMGGDTMGFIVAVGPRNETLAPCLRHSLLKGNVSFLIKHQAFCFASSASLKDKRAAFNCTLAAWRQENDTNNLVAIPPERQKSFLHPREFRGDFLLQLFGNPMAAVHFDNPSLLRSVLQSGADVNAFHLAAGPVEFSWITARWSRMHILAACIFFDAPKCFKMLLSYEGVNFNSNIEPFASSKILGLAIVDAMTTTPCILSLKKNRTEAERLFFLNSLLELPSIDVNASIVDGTFCPPLKRILVLLIFYPVTFPLGRCISVCKLLINSGANVHLEFVFDGKTVSYLQMLKLLAVDKAFGRELLVRHGKENLPGGVAGLAVRCKELLAATCAQDGSDIAI